MPQHQQHQLFAYWSSISSPTPAAGHPATSPPLSVMPHSTRVIVLKSRKVDALTCAVIFYGTSPMTKKLIKDVLGLTGNAKKFVLNIPANACRIRSWDAMLEKSAETVMGQVLPGGSNFSDSATSLSSPTVPRPLSRKVASIHLWSRPTPQRSKPFGLWDVQRKNPGKRGCFGWRLTGTKAATFYNATRG